MPTEPFVVERFSGLNLALDPFEVGATGATDLLNVDFDRLGRLRMRDGTSQWNASTISSSGYSAIFGTSAALFGSSTALGLLAVRYSSGGNVQIDALDVAGTISTSGGAFAGAANTFALSSTSLGTAVGAATYITFATLPSTGITIQRMAGFGVSTGAGKPLYVGTSTRSNRLVQAGYFTAADSPTGANGTRSTVFFSDAGAPDTYSANNWVALRPGDGEVITAIAMWQDLIYVFKQSSVFIFYGESVDGDGNPIFAFRRVDLPDPMSDPVLSAPFSRYTVTGTDGVYFSTSKGIWRIAVGGAELISGPVGKIFSTDPTISSSVQAAGSAPASLSWVTGRLVAAYTAAATRQLVWDPAIDTWTLWDLPASMFAEYPAGTSTRRDALYYVRGSGNNNVFVMKPANTTDSGSAISWSWKSGRYPLSEPGRVAVTQESSVYGSGTVTLALDSDLYSSQSASATLGTSPAVAEGWPAPVDQEGTWIQHTLSGSGAAQVSRLTHYVSFVKPAGIR